VGDGECRTGTLKGAGAQGRQLPKVRRIEMQKHILLVFLLSLALSSMYAQTTKKKLSIASLAFTVNTKEYEIGAVVDVDLFSCQNGFIDFFPDAKIPAYLTKGYEIGWNNRNRIIFIRIKSTEYMTKDNLAVGDFLQKVESVLGTPYVRDDSSLKYFDDEYEHIEIRFSTLDKKTVHEIIMFVWM